MDAPPTLTPLDLALANLNSALECLTMPEYILVGNAVDHIKTAIEYIEDAQEDR